MQDVKQRVALTSIAASAALTAAKDNSDGPLRRNVLLLLGGTVKGSTKQIGRAHV